MRLHIISIAAATTLLATGANAQNYQRRADIRGGGNNNVGKCTVEVVVDGAAQVEIRGDSAVLRNLKGQQPQWQRFECTSPVPANPADFRFSGVDGRGSQRLVRDPRQGGVTVVEINDPDNGQDRYKFDITWGTGRGGPMTQQYPGRPDDRGGVYGGGVYRDNGGAYRGGDRRFAADQAVELCQSTVRQQAADRFRTNDVTFRRTNMDEAPGRGEWVVGTMEARRPGAPDQILKFSCSVDFANGSIRSAQVEPFYAEGNGPQNQYPAQRDTRSAAIQNCQRAVQERVQRDGYNGVQFGNARFDDQSGRDDSIVGDLRASGRYGNETLRFSCSVDPRDGDVRSIDVTTRR